MKWLQWSQIDLEFGLGGVEEHARSIARELRAQGIEVSFSRDPAELASNAWDVIHTHGDGYQSPHRRAISVHTLHGTTFGRMLACGELAWPGGYRAEGMELYGTLRSDVTLSVHPNLSLFRLAKRMGKVAAVCGNGWDSGEGSEGLPEALKARIDRKRPLWVFVGRGDDPVKGADRLLPVLREDEFQFAAVPGTGFESANANVIRTGRLSAAQVRALFKEASGAVIPSRYEGGSLVLLEALAAGLRVVSTPVGYARILPSEVQGLEVLKSSAPDAIDAALRRAQSLDGGANVQQTREERAQKNRAVLPRWQEVARIALEAVREAQARKGGR